MLPAGDVDIVQGPSVEPITTAEAKSWLRVTTSDQDTEIDNAIRTARGHAQRYLDRSIIRQVVRLDMPCFLDRTYMRRGRAIQVLHVKYIDEAGTLQTLAASNYTLTNPSEGASYLHRGWNVVWPTVRAVPNAVQITYVAGYEAGNSPTDPRALVPEEIKTGLKKLVQYHYDDLSHEDRAALLQSAYVDLAPHRLMSF